MSPATMLPPSLTSLSSSSALRSLTSPQLCSSLPKLNKPSRARSETQITLKRTVRSGICRAELSHDAPFAAAIGACMLSSLVLPYGVSTETPEGTESAFDSTEARLTAMSIISFIPYFNWLSWVFAWLDTGKRRYAVYALAYLAPYLRSNLSLSPEESWLPVASIVLGIIHVQLEVSIKSGDIQGFQVFNEAAKFLSSLTKKKETSEGHHQGPYGKGREEHRDLPSAKERSRNDLNRWRVPRDASEPQEDLNGGWDEDEGRKK